MTLSTGSVVRTVGLREVQLKLLKAAPTILAQNKVMVTTMLKAVQEIVEPETPLGPGHFGYHGRDTFKVHVLGGQGLTKTVGRLIAAVQIYWREFGTRGRFRGRRNQRRAYAAAIGAFGTGGEKAGLYATHALAGVRKFLLFYYGKAQWWRL